MHLDFDVRDDTTSYHFAQDMISSPGVTQMLRHSTHNDFYHYTKEKNSINLFVSYPIKRVTYDDIS
jgi:hypothetical protein